MNITLHFDGSAVSRCAEKVLLTSHQTAMFLESFLEVSNYDVLFEKDGSLAKTKDHVGNNRFEVFLELHRQEFLQAKSQLARDLVVNKIMDTVCRQCVPNGRFLERDGDQWILMGSDEAARERITQALTMGLETESPKPSLTRHVTEEGEATRYDNDTPKRRRRGSLHRLRRSISESMVPSNSINSMRSSMPGTRINDPAPSNSVHPKWMSERSLFSKPPMTPATPLPRTVSLTAAPLVVPRQMDVILNADGVSLNSEQSLVGNNRFRFLMDLHIKNTNLEETAADLVQTVTTHWKGRFLKATSAFSRTDLQELSISDAAVCVTTMLRHQQTATIPPFAMPPQQQQTQALTSSAPATFLSGINHTTEIRNMRLAAIKGLKERKQKRRVVDRMIGQRQASNESLQGGLSSRSLPSSFNLFKPK